MAQTVYIILYYIILFFLCRPKAGDTSSDEEAKEVTAVACQERLQPADGQAHPSPHTYRKSLRLSSDQIVRTFFNICFSNFGKYCHLRFIVKLLFHAAYCSKAVVM